MPVLGVFTSVGEPFKEGARFRLEPSPKQEYLLRTGTGVREVVVLLDLESL